MTGPVAPSRLALEAKPFAALAGREVHEILALRAAVFVVEQRCPYLDPDRRDPEAIHLLGRLAGLEEPAAPALATYARWYGEGAGTRIARSVRLGRVVTAPPVRGRGLGRRTVEEALARIGADHPDLPVRVHAQAHLAAWYETFGFTATGEPFDEDGVPHVAMVRPPA